MKRYIHKSKSDRRKDNEFKKEERKAVIFFLGTEIKAKSIDVKNFNKVESLRNSIKSITQTKRHRQN